MCPVVNTCRKIPAGACPLHGLARNLLGGRGAVPHSLSTQLCQEQIGPTSCSRALSVAGLMMLGRNGLSTEGSARSSAGGDSL